jgi:hypothetical protein
MLAKCLAHQARRRRDGGRRLPDSESHMQNQQHLTELETALRVLAALTRSRHPAASDIEALQSYAGPRANVAVSLDELACSLVHQALKRRGEVTSDREAFRK